MRDDSGTLRPATDLTARIPGPWDMLHESNAKTLAELEKRLRTQCIPDA
ncbi:MAG: hypothetical protein M3Z15_00675 [Pseudomonadota bacterium]|nr:hypothetical protein [Pseudomonadota bacterium]